MAPGGEAVQNVGLELHIQRNRWLLAAASIGLLAVTLVLGSRKYGAVNWISLGPLSFQPSEMMVSPILTGAEPSTFSPLRRTPPLESRS